MFLYCYRLLLHLILSASIQQPLFPINSRQTDRQSARIFVHRLFECKQTIRMMFNNERQNHVSARDRATRDTQNFKAVRRERELKEKGMLDKTVLQEKAPTDIYTHTHTQQTQANTGTHTPNVFDLFESLYRTDESLSRTLFEMDTPSPQHTHTRTRAVAYSQSENVQLKQASQRTMHNIISRFYSIIINALFKIMFL